ncbi:MAG: ABC transporter permease [Oscillospiraceae bacterium]|jgi:putative ABC transport system permease protein|nr:ABC transporter permease [Oscillospiraceae bacterium]
MIMDFLKSAFRNLKRKRTRTVLTVLGITIGVSSVIIISNISQCGTDSLNNELNSLGLSGLSISVNDGKNASITEDDLSLIRKFSQVEQATPVLMENTRVAVRNNTTTALLWGIDSEASDIISLQVLYGRLLNRRDITTRANVCLVDEQFSKNAYHRSNMIGKTISFPCGGIEQDFTVVGVIKTGTGLLQNLIGNYIPTFVYVPYTTIQAASGQESFDEVAVKICSGDNAENVGEMIVKHLNLRSGTEGAFVSNNLAKQKDGLLQVLDLVTLILSAVGAISLLVASLSIMTVMLVSVNERTREIGIKKALGATRSSIMLEFLFEAGLISLIGCLIGIGAGFLISCAGASAFHVTFHIRIDIILMVTGFSVLSGSVFGVYPAYKAARLKPVDALRQE